MARAAYSGGSTSLNDFKQLALLGEGAYSAVYKVLRLADNEIYALKKVKLPSLSDKEKQNALNEVRLLASVQHDNVIAYKEAFWDEKTRCLCIVQECADAGDLLQQINRCKQERAYLREGDIWRYLDGMCQGLRALHDLRILHRDMKCANVFLSQSRDGPIAKLGDFNVSKVAKRGLCMTQTGTPYYASPEVWRDMPYDAKSDMWSLGCVLYEMVALRPPFRAEDMEGLYRKVVRGQYPRIPAHYSQDLGDVIAALLQVHPRNRPSVDQLLQMPAMMRHTSGLARDDSKHVSDLLSTIKLPKNVIDLSGCLPKPRYALPDEIREEQDAFQDSPSQLPSHQSRRQQAAGELPPLPGPVSQQRRVPQSMERGMDRGLPPSSYPDSEVINDSLDAYLQQRHEVSDLPPVNDSRGGNSLHRNEPSEQRGLAMPPIQRRRQQEVAQDYGIGRLPETESVSGTRGGGGGVVRLPAVDAGRGQYGPSPTVNPHYSQQPRNKESRRPMSIYARQQYAAADSNPGPPPQSSLPPAQVEAPKDSGTRQRRSLIPRLF